MKYKFVVKREFEIESETQEKALLKLEEELLDDALHSGMSNWIEAAEVVYDD
jgi:hypothetical protein